MIIKILTLPEPTRAHQCAGATSDGGGRASSAGRHERVPHACSHAHCCQHVHSQGLSLTARTPLRARALARPLRHPRCTSGASRALLPAAHDPHLETRNHGRSCFIVLRITERKKPPFAPRCPGRASPGLPASCCAPAVKVAVARGRGQQARGEALPPREVLVGPHGRLPAEEVPGVGLVLRARGDVGPHARAVLPRCLKRSGEMTRERRSIRFLLALRTCAPWGARVQALTVEFVNNREKTTAKGVAIAISQRGDGVHDDCVKCPDWTSVA